jgi:hypothetical protein
MKRTTSQTGHPPPSPFTYQVGPERKETAPPHLIGASLPCQDDDVRMATATILLAPARGSRRGGWPLRGIKATLVALISLRGNPFQRKRNDGIDPKHDCSEKRLPVDSIGIFSSPSSTPGPSCQAGLLPAAAAATPGTGFHIHRCVSQRINE